MLRLVPRPVLALAILFGLPVAAAAEGDEPGGVEIVRPVPRGPGQHGFTIEVPHRPDAFGNFSGIEVMRGSRLPAEAYGPVDQSLPPATGLAAGAVQAPSPRRFTAIQVRPVRPVEIAPVAPVGRHGDRAVRIQRGMAPQAPLAAADPDGEASPLPFTLPPGARTIRIR